MVKYTLLFFLIFSVNAMADVEVLADPTKPLDYKAKTVNKKQRSLLPEPHNRVAKELQQAMITHADPTHCNMQGAAGQ